MATETKLHRIQVQTAWSMLHQVADVLHEASGASDDGRFEDDARIAILSIESAKLDVKSLADNHGIVLFDYPQETV